MSPGMQWEAIPEALLEDLAQLTKANSIEGKLAAPMFLPGNKKSNITVIYTPSANLKKDGSMDIGQVSFQKAKTVKKILISERTNEIINRLNKTKRELHPDLQAEKLAMEKEARRRDRLAKEEEERAQTAWIAEKKKEKALYGNGYETLHQEEFMYSNKGLDLSKSAAELEEDFM
ncbi:hypothetical protein HDU91_003936 [Kappamyces sp. JEL0680]|nr:hypothetical protein HDU91_003936 [Kappamyces sp. JEL0680]